ncbi:MAG: CDP-alcohol phosphatidyltransferase family protein [Erysipelotrichaceae bacterium]|nr:CDP-alcohol phosphatidyltransferase family protein [Erysipelotrichaceae bacterium]
MFTKKEIFTIPNILSYFRIALVPIFIYVYFHAESQQDHFLSAGILVLSSLSDLLDGLIARKFDMITDLGKLIDPIADKLTQLVVALALMSTYHLYTLLVFIILVKDGMLLFIGYYIYRKTGRHINQAQLPGKIATALFFVVSIALIAFYLPNTAIANIMITLTSIFMVIAMLYYAIELYHVYQGIV